MSKFIIIVAALCLFLSGCGVEDSNVKELDDTLLYRVDITAYSVPIFDACHVIDEAIRAYNDRLIDVAELDYRISNNIASIENGVTKILSKESIPQEKIAYHEDYKHQLERVVDLLRLLKQVIERRNGASYRELYPQYTQAVLDASKAWMDINKE